MILLFLWKLNLKTFILERLSKFVLFIFTRDIAKLLFQLLHKKQVLCSKCRGTGAKSQEDIEKCPVCKGKGIRIVTQQLAPGFVQQMQTTYDLWRMIYKTCWRSSIVISSCDRCGGKGQTIKATCPHCKGKKVEKDEEKISLIIERGMPDGYKIVCFFF